MGLVINEELCQVVWRIINKNFMHKYSFIVSALLGRFKIPSEREGGGKGGGAIFIY